MSDFSRRDFLRQGGLGLATWGAAELVLRADARPTASSGDVGSYARYLRAERQAAQPPARPVPDSERREGNKNFVTDKRAGNYALPGKAAPTEDNILGPFYRMGAPFRAKITPPLEAGTVLVISGRVWGFDTKKPLANAVLDIWQANAKGRYDNDDPKNPLAKDVFRNRARLIADETGYYEFETIHPAPYQIGPNTWRPSHIHYLVRCPGYKNLVTQLYFKGDKHNKTDEFIKESLIVELREQKVGAASCEVGSFDIVLTVAPAQGLLAK